MAHPIKTITLSSVLGTTTYRKFQDGLGYSYNSTLEMDTTRGGITTDISEEKWNAVEDRADRNATGSVIPTEKWRGEEEVVIVLAENGYGDRVHEIGLRYAQGGISFLDIKPFKIYGAACKYVDNNFHGKDHPDNRMERVR